MAGENKTYTVYQITAPDGFCYIGYTSMSVSERWRHHKRRAFDGESIGHPLYDRIREYAGTGFLIKSLYETDNRFTAMKLEEKAISEVPKEKSANVSSGGLNDSKEGGKLAWEKINSTPESREEYLKKLSVTKKNNDWSNYDQLSKRALEWRKQHPYEAYMQSCRASRIARRKQPKKETEQQLSLKERLLRKYKPNQIKSQSVTSVWENRDAESRKAIGHKISESKKKYMDSLSDKERVQITEKARAAIDRNKQGQAASNGIKKWWEELKKDPKRYGEYIERRKRTQRETLQKKKGQCL